MVALRFKNHSVFGARQDFFVGLHGVRQINHVGSGHWKWLQSAIFKTWAKLIEQFTRTHAVECQCVNAHKVVHAAIELEQIKGGKSKKEDKLDYFLIRQKFYEFKYSILQKISKKILNKYIKLTLKIKTLTDWNFFYDT
jgi:hypothetical protein